MRFQFRWSHREVSHQSRIFGRCLAHAPESLPARSQAARSTTVDSTL